MIKRVKRFVRFVFVLVLLGIIFVASTNLYMIQYSKAYIIDEAHLDTLNTQCVMVLGAGVVDNQPTLILQDRLDTGINLYKNGYAKKIIMSGDHRQLNYDEVNVMKEYAINAGVPSEDVFMDHAGFSTYESMYRARDVFDVNDMIIVTQDYHMYRALYNARKLGINAYGVNSTKSGKNFFGQGYRDLREAIARTKDFIYCIIQPKPTFLGDVIQITGDGNFTND